MNSDTSLAAWMIAGGPRNIDPADARNRAHVRELAAARGERNGTSLMARVGAAIAAWRLPATVAEAPCCPA